ncbi:MAG: DNA mismatch repair endonuclease MutL [Rikenellaceae bacterium]|nr:DNA mismatch repair endonuclease MutL [Rikenellaceae bacterium]
MSDRIKVLPDLVSNQIAAGEVVESPATAIKELLENAVDAGSTSVTLNFRNAGKELIQIKDNGCGMSPIDARLAFDRHATSKITSLEDIYRLGTFGFRGEALAAIAAISQVELHSRTADDEVGTKTVIHGGVFQGQTPVAAPVGSQFYIRNLFYNVPVRRTFLENSTRESTSIIREFKRVALCHPEVEFKLYKDDALMYDLPVASLAQRIAGVAGNRNLTSKLLDVKVETSIVNVSGFVAHPSTARLRATDREQYLFVNGRYFESPYFNKAIIQAFEKLVPQGYQPSFFLYLDIDPSQIDVNVHPRKINIKFSDKAAVWQIINAAVRETLAKTGVVPLMEFDENVPEIPVLTDERSPMREPEVTTRKAYNPFVDYEPQTRRSSADLSDFAMGYNFPTPSSAEGADLTETSIEWVEQDSVPQTLDVECDSELKFESVTPLDGGLCVALQNGRLTVIDLRRAREAVLYDEYMRALNNNRSLSQILLFPEQINMSIEDYTLLKDHETEFITFGFDIRFRGEGSIELAGVPSDADMDTIDCLLYDMLEAIRSDIMSPEDVRREKMARLMARSAARPLGKLSQLEAEKLLKQLAACSDFSYTPCGKQIMTTFDVEELKNRLK